MVAHLGHRLAMPELAATSAAPPASLAGHGTQSFRNERVLRIRNSPMSVYHNPRFPPAPPALGVRDLMPSKSPSEAVPESIVCGLDDAYDRELWGNGRPRLVRGQH